MNTNYRNVWAQIIPFALAGACMDEQASQVTRPVAPVATTPASAAEDPSASRPGAGDSPRGVAAEPSASAHGTGGSASGGGTAASATANNGAAGTAASGSSPPAPAAQTPMAGSGGAGTGGTSGVVPRSLPPCLKEPSQLVIVGDSYLTIVGDSEILPDVSTFSAELAKETGVAYRNRAAINAWLGPRGATSAKLQSLGADSLPPRIPELYADAVAEDSDILAVIMTGGGDDLFAPNLIDYPDALDCKNDPDSPGLKACQDVVTGLAAELAALFAKMSADGVQDVVYVFYPQLAEGISLSIGGAHPNELLGYLSGVIKPLCDSAQTTTGGRLRCHFVDLGPVFAGHSDWFSSIDDYHVNFAGAGPMSTTVAAVLKERCIAQSEGSGCCAP